MRKSFILCAAIFTLITAVIFSCKRLNVPVPASTCIQVKLSSAVHTDSQTITVNTPIVPITYTVSSNTAGDTSTLDTIHVNFSGALPPGVTENFSNGIVTISGTPTTSVGSPFTYTVTTTGSSCNNLVITGSITVTNCSTISLTSAPATTLQGLNINTAIVPITYSIGGGATSATVTGLPPGVTGSFSAGTFTISGIPTSSGRYTYTVTTAGGTCTSTATGIISTELLILSSGNPDQTVCSGTSITPIVYTAGGGATGAALTGTLPTGVTSALNGTTFTISGTPTAAVSSPFTFTVTSTGGSNGETNLIGAILVNSLPRMILTSSVATAAQTLSVNTAITNIIYTIGGSATGVILTGAPAGVTGTLTGTTFTIAGSPTASGPFTYTVTTTGGSCSNVALTGTITATP